MKLKAEGFQRNFEPVGNPLTIGRTSVMHVNIQTLFYFSLSF